MDRRILPMLRCPVSGGSLDLIEIDGDTADGLSQVRTGILHCKESKLWYPIIAYVPVMLTFPTALVDGFARDHESALRALPDYRAPPLAPMPGEASVQRTFTEEWQGLGDDERTFIYSDSELVALHRDVWLQLTDGERAGVKTVLDVGCGFGKEAIVLADIFPNAEVFGVDLNLSLLQAGPNLKQHRRVHPIIASLFRLPFAKESLDHVHCQGVLHHTYSTEEGFKSLSPLPRRGGSLFVWVYAHEDSMVVPGFRGALIRIYWLVSHRIGRPILSRLPGPVRNGAMTVMAALLHPLIKLRDRSQTSWRFRNTLHGLRDAFTPRYAHQHGFNEVLTWFEDAGFEPRLQSPARYRDLIGKRLLGVGVFGRKVKAG
ncbi:MAG TPA: methyltransferase domain-containing protein [Candidatus Cybelea sp.]|nr:methyltransferase domain-containing protein [Candidatus Cybelea sp.]